MKVGLSKKNTSRLSNDKSPAIIEYPGIINSLDGGPSKESLSCTSWIMTNLFNSMQQTIITIFLNVNIIIIHFTQVEIQHLY